MKVILLRDVAKMGRRFEVKDVPDGHALNFLIPKKFAEIATKEALRRLSVEMKKKTIMTDRRDVSFKSVLEQLATETFEMKVTANEQGHLFKGIHASDISTYLKEKGMHVEASEVLLEHPIKEVGEHTIPLKSGEISGAFTLVISKA